MKNRIVICPHCSATLRIPAIQGKRQIRCGACHSVFGIPQASLETKSSPKKRKRSPWFRPAIVLGLIVAVIVGIGFLVKKVDTPAKWITVSYDGLLDKSQLTQSGEPLSVVLQTLGTSPLSRGEVQPFLAPQASLLIDVADTICPSSGAPWINLGNYFEATSAQPAWVALMRAGEVIVAATGDGRARVFAPGADPLTAYQSCYGVVRHALAGILPQDGSMLSVEVFAFENEYANREIRLNTTPHIFKASSFPPPKGKRELDLAGLELFLQEGTVLEGGSLSDDEGLVLYGSKGEPQTLAGNPISLSDLAVAYRAVFHAGDNTAFISLDPNIDPTKVTVNFGGYLEDTAIGSVVLEADKRFKTLSTGLDPNTYRDLRNVIRTRMPGFETSSEREANDGSYSRKSSWVGTRFWFYPESIQVETDFDGLFARIANAQFTADAERSRSDFVDMAQFETYKKSHLSPHIRRAIDDLNANYSRYASIFPELRELWVVGRLMGLMSWLNGVGNSAVDLDGLLAVHLPAFSTDRWKTQLLTSTTVVQSDGIQGRMHGKVVVTNLTPILDMTIKEHFKDQEKLAGFLATSRGGDEGGSQLWMAEAERILQDFGHNAVRTLIRNKEDLKALVSDASKHIEAPAPETVSIQKAALGRIKARILSLKNELNQLEPLMARSAETHNQFLGRYNEMVDEHNNLQKDYNFLLDQLNASNLISNYITEIGGGISLRPKEFSVRERVGSSLVSEMRTKSRSTKTKLPKIAPKGTWVRTRIGAAEIRNASMPLELKAGALPSKSMAKRILNEWELGASGKYWQSREEGRASWRDQTKRIDGTQRERYYDPGKSSLDIIERGNSGSQNHIVGLWTSKDRIVFTKVFQQPIADPGSPPFWFQRQETSKIP